MYSRNLNFAKVTFNICKAIESEDTEKIYSIGSEITHIKEIEEIKWLCETIQTIENKKPRPEYSGRG